MIRSWRPAEQQFIHKSQSETAPEIIADAWNEGIKKEKMLDEQGEAGL